MEVVIGSRSILTLRPPPVQDQDEEERYIRDDAPWEVLDPMVLD